ncbi:hypothetical protein GFK94_18360 [Pseudomonas balearica]|nr:hypothetical protein [Stutzerimonas balearica]MBK3828013.1 hypothetical protein [Stutzerimonas balearica]MBK3857698.1 hypothetical protein [Stutzerimonas balearica]
MCGQEKVTKKKATPASGFCCAKLPSLRRYSGGRREGRPCPFTPRSASCLASPCAAPTLGLLKGIRDRVAWRV